MAVLSPGALLFYELKLLKGSSGSSASYIGASGKPSTWLPLVELAELPPSWGAVILCWLILSFPRLTLPLLGYACLSWALCAFLGCLWCPPCATMTSGWSCSAPGLRAQYKNKHGAFGGSSPTHKLCYSSPASWCDEGIRSTSCLKHAFATSLFASHRACSFPGRIITLRANGSFGSELKCPAYTHGCGVNTHPPATGEMETSPAR